MDHSFSTSGRVSSGETVLLVNGGLADKCLMTINLWSEREKVCVTKTLVGQKDREREERVRRNTEREREVGGREETQGGGGWVEGKGREDWIATAKSTTNKEHNCKKVATLTSPLVHHCRLIPRGSSNHPPSARLWTTVEQKWINNRSKTSSHTFLSSHGEGNTHSPGKVILLASSFWMLSSPLT